MQVMNGDALRVRSHIQGHVHFAARTLDGHGHGPEAEFQFLIDDGVTVAADQAQHLPQLFDRVYGALGVASELDPSEIRFQFLRRQMGQQNAAHGRTERRQAAADAEVDRHDARHVRARDIDNIETVQGRDGTGLVQKMADMFQDRLGRRGQGLAGAFKRMEFRRTQGTGENGWLD